jgi:glycosyltransferase involved in cell wall biosynthesis
MKKCNKIDHDNGDSKEKIYKDRSMPFFSIIIPVYNRTEGLRRCLDSVYNQCYSDYEVIVVDDGSSEGFSTRIKQYVTSYGKPQFHVYRVTENKGGGYARNFGMGKARGKYICFLDSDDEWDDDKLRVCHEQIQKKSDIGLVYTPIRNYLPRGKKEIVPETGVQKNELLGDYIFWRIGGGRGLQTSSLVVDAGLAKEVLFDSELRGHQDWDFILRLDLRRPSVIFIPSPKVNRYISRVNSGLGNVSRGLSYEFTYKFYIDHRHLMSRCAARRFRSRILFPKSLFHSWRFIWSIIDPALWLDMAFLVKFLLRGIRKISRYGKNRIFG